MLSWSKIPPPRLADGMEGLGLGPKEGAGLGAGLGAAANCCAGRGGAGCEYDGEALWDNGAGSAYDILGAGLKRKRYTSIE